MYVIYDSEGNIIRLTTSKKLAPGEFLLVCNEVVDDSAYYVDLNNRVLKQKQDYIIDFLPIPSTIIIEGQTYFVTEQPTFEFDTPGTYTIRVVPDSPQYLEKEFEYVVEA